VDQVLVGVILEPANLSNFILETEAGSFTWIDMDKSKFNPKSWF